MVNSAKKKKITRICSIGNYKISLKLDSTKERQKHKFALLWIFWQATEKLESYYLKMQGKLIKVLNNNLFCTQKSFKVWSFKNAMHEIDSLSHFKKLQTWNGFMLKA